jgi:hypothetical protein
VEKGKIVITGILGALAAMAAAVGLSQQSTPPPAPPHTLALPVGTPAPRSIGMNLSGVSYWSTEDPFLDLMKGSDPWVDDSEAPIPVDKDGWPTRVPAGSGRIGTAFYVGTDLVQNQRRALRITFDGQGTITSNAFGGSIKSGGVVTPANGLNYAVLKVSDLNPAKPFRNLHIVRKDQAAAFDAGEIFNPAFIDRMKHWSTLRFMDWNKTNGSEVTSWSQRSTPASASWAASATGVPIEVEIALANKVHADPWINVPIKADDDFIRQLTTYARDHLDPTLTLHLELSNEVWNTSFAQATWAQAQGKAKWGDAGGKLWWYGWRAVQMSQIARGVYGSDAAKRLSVVISSQTAWLGLENDVWHGVQLANGTDSLFNEWAITTYWGAQLGDTDAASHAKVLAWANGGATGMDAAFAEIEHGGALANDNSLDSQKPIYAYQAKVAKTHGLKLVAYEGAFGVTTFQFPTQAEQDVGTAFMARLQADPRMGKLYTRMAEDFFAAGGTTLNVFSDVGPASKWGTWGTLDNLYASSPRYDALVAVSGR